MKIHFLGIGGSGASAVAAIAQDKGFEVTGCDQNPDNEFTKNFKPRELSKGHSPKHLDNVDILTVTPAVFSQDPDNIEIKEAKNKGIEVLTWQQFMGKYLEKNKFVIAVCGTHGKSTVTALVGLMLEEAGLDPTVELGALVPKWGKNYRLGNSDYFLTEADEFNDNFLASFPDITILTSVEMDHPEYFKDFNHYKKSFKNFLSQTKKLVIANLEDRGVREVLEIDRHSGELARPESDSRQARMTDIQTRVVDYSKNILNFKLQIPGEFNILNAKAVLELGLYLGIDFSTIKEVLENFAGIGRRFELVGKFEEVPVFSDYAHHPTELRVNLNALKKKFPDKKITVIFEPHMFSRTKTLLPKFVQVFKNSPVEKVIIMDIFQSREKDTGIISSKELVEKINNDNVIYIPTGEEVLKYLKTNTPQVIFFAGAGDIDQYARELVK